MLSSKRWRTLRLRFVVRVGPARYQGALLRVRRVTAVAL
jgi:hypothetical protein